MNIVLKIVFGLILLGLGYLLTSRVIPWIFTKIGRLLGFKMRVTPLTERRINRFKGIKRGYWSFAVITTVFVLSLFLELYVNKRPLYISFEDDQGQKTALVPALSDWLSWVPLLNSETGARAVARDFGLEGEGEVPYRQYAEWVRDPPTLEKKAQEIEKGIERDEERFRAQLVRDARAKGEDYDPGAPLPEMKLRQYEDMREQAAYYRRLVKVFESGRAFILPTLHPYSPTEQLLELEGSPPHRAFSGQPGVPPLGTDFEGKDVLAQLLYGFRVSFTFAIIVAFIGFSIGISVGAIMGYFGGWVDILVQRFIEIWSAIPFLFTLMILGSIYSPGFFLMACLLVALRAWIGITYTIRGEYYREKSRDYVQAARAIGVRNPKIMARHIFPNALVPVVTFMPFAIVSYISVLVALDYLGFGLPPDIPSWGRLLRQGADNIVNYPALVFFPILALACTLFCVVMVGEAVREAFDPKLYSRLR